MTEEEIRNIVQSISKMLDIDTPTVLFEEYWNDIYLESGLYQGWEYVIFNPYYVKTASIETVFLAIAHEVRHTYQATQIRHMIEGDTYDPNATLWAVDMEDGVSDTLEDSKEIDAVVFSHFLAAAILNAGFDVAIMTDADEMRSMFEGLKTESWYKPEYDSVVFYDRENAIYIGQKDLLPNSKSLLHYSS